MEQKNETSEGRKEAQILQDSTSPEDIKAFIKTRVRITRKRLNLQAFIGLFIFGWLMKVNYDDLGEKGFGWAFLISMAIVFAIGKQAEPMAFIAMPFIYIAAWIHTNILLTNLENQARESFLNTKENKTDVDSQI